MMKSRAFQKERRKKSFIYVGSPYKLKRIASKKKLNGE